MKYWIIPMRVKPIYCSVLSFMCLMVSSNGAMGQASRWGHVEDSLGAADSAFTGNLKWHNVRRPYENIILASGTVVTTKTIWGERPKIPIDIGEKEFLVYGGSGVRNIWDEVGVRTDGIETPLLFLSRGQGPDLEIIFVVGPDQNGALARPEDLLAVRALEARPDGPELREALINGVIKPESSELLWTYALRRLYRLEDSPDRRFDLVLHPLIQEKSPYAPSKGDAGGGRLWYATRLLTGPDVARTADQVQQPSTEERRAVYVKLLKAFEETPSSYMAETAIDRFDEPQIRKAEFSDHEWSQFLSRIRAAIGNPEHPIHKISEERRPSVDQALERLLGEPNMLDTKKADRAEE